VDDAFCVRNSAAKIMAGLAEKHLGEAPASDAPCCSEKPLIGELVSTSTAFAINCVTNLEMHLASARRLGASERQIENMLGVARTVKKVAAQKVEAAVEMVAADPTKASDVCADDCDCGEVEMVTAAPAKASDGCVDDCSCHAGLGQPIQATKESVECACGETGRVAVT